MSNLNQFYESWWFLFDHPAFFDNSGNEGFTQSLDIHPAMVNPENLRIDEDPSKNTKLQIWLECGPWYKDENYAGYSHDIELDCGADTFEEAVIKLSGLVRNKYGGK